MPSDPEPRLTRGHRKKEKTRRHLLAAGLRVLRSKGESLSARDVTEEADVSSGTFYNYFADTDALIDAIMRDQLLGMNAHAAPESTSDPALRLARTATRILEHAIADPQWARLALRLVNRPGEPNQLNGHLRDDLLEGLETGRFTRGADETTLDQSIGLLLMTIRRIVVGNAPPQVVPRMVERLLENLGVSETEARDLAASASSQ
ncbi:MAG: TetR/AcrR family transcriptional regulator [Myxococcota bacterium]|nr:TetR/AcrR family transcriptional regulator [Myxococcota bacterium]